MNEIPTLTLVKPEKKTSLVSLKKETVRVNLTTPDQIGRETPDRTNVILSPLLLASAIILLAINVNTACMWAKDFNSFLNY
jgi:hypothetical protein